jgi:predicted RNase H-like HicB family nuclease
MKFTIEFEQEPDGRWLAEILELPGVMSYGASANEAIGHAKALALRVVADQIEHNERSAMLTEISFAMAA